MRREVDEHLRVPAPPQRPRRHVFLRAWFVVIAIIVFLTVIAGLIQKWLWMRQLHYLGIFWTLLSVRWAMFGVAFACAFAFLWINFRFAAKAIHAMPRGNQIDHVAFVNAPPNLRKIDFDISPRILAFVIGAAVAILSLIFALSVSSQWDTCLRFRYGGHFGLLDPLFRIDAGFYLFRLPFYELLQGGLCLPDDHHSRRSPGLLRIVRTVAGKPRPRADRPPQYPAASVGASFILVANWGWGFYLDHYELVYSTLGVVYGAGYTADHVTVVVLWIMVGVSVAACALLVLNFFRPRFKAVAAGAVVYAVIYFGGIIVLPQFFQKFVVQPSELRWRLPI